jgi:two-component system, chemotaxis family, chemotaxis protein CheY
MSRRSIVKGRVLVIDDEAEIRRNLTFGLMQEGYGVVACPDGISAIHELDHARDQGVAYDFLVTDIFMPDIDGLKILKVIKSQYPDMPVVVITGFGDEGLKFSALTEENTAYLDKPFEIPELVSALDSLAPASPQAAQAANEAPVAPRESVSAYVTIRIVDRERSMDVFQEIRALPGVETCDAVRGDVDVIVLAHADSNEAMGSFFTEVRAIPGLSVVSTSPVERPTLDRDVEQFVEIYRKAVKRPPVDTGKKGPGASSYIIVDVDPTAIQQIFTTMFFIEDVIFCDVIDAGTRLVGMITGTEAVGRTPRIIEKIGEIDGVLRVREARIIRMLDD